VVVRQVTLITVVVLVGFMVLSPGYFAPYGTPIGQVILATLLTLYVAAIWGLRRITLPRPRGRILRGERA
jgi:tight adherence protein B